MCIRNSKEQAGRYLEVFCSKDYSNFIWIRGSTKMLNYFVTLLPNQFKSPKIDHSGLFIVTSFICKQDIGVPSTRLVKTECVKTNC